MIGKIFSALKSLQETLTSFRAVAEAQANAEAMAVENLYFTDKLKAVYRSQSIVKAYSKISNYDCSVRVVRNFKAHGVGFIPHSTFDGILIQAQYDIERHRRSTKKRFTDLYYQWEEYLPEDVWSEFLQEMRAEYLEAEKYFSSLQQRIRAICKRISLGFRTSDKRVELKKKHQVVFKKIDDEDPTK